VPEVQVELLDLIMRLMVLIQYFQQLLQSVVEVEPLGTLLLQVTAEAQAAEALRAEDQVHQIKDMPEEVEV
jgi:hypothetical protein